MHFFKYVMLKLLVSEAPHIHSRLMAPKPRKLLLQKPKDVLICGTLRVFLKLLGNGSQADGSVSEQRKIRLCLNPEHSSVKGGYKDLPDGHFVTKYSFLSVSRAS